jgi:hypothetical protein
MERWIPYHSPILCGKINPKEYMVTKEEVKRFIEMPGHIRGSALLSDAENVKNRVGKQDFQKLRQTMEELGLSVDYGTIRAMGWYPIGWRMVFFVVLKDLFGWVDDDFRELGYNAPKYSFIVKFMMKFLASPEGAFRKAPEYWKRYYSVGTLEIGGFDEASGHVSLYLKDFKAVPSYCRFLEGFFQRLMQYLRPDEEVHCVEGKCEHRGEECHEFRISW